MRNGSRAGGWLGVVVVAACLATRPALAADPPAAAPAPPAGSGTAPAPPHREPSSGDLATARGALRDGLALRDKGDLAGALGRFTTAWESVRTPVTGFELGKTHMLLGHVVEAQRLFLEVVRMPASLEESARSQTARDESERLAKDMTARIPTLKIKLTLAPGASAVVRIDDEQLPPTSAAETVRAVEPGGHDVTAQAGDGPEQKVHVEVAEGEARDVALAPKWIKPKVVAAPGSQVIYVQQTNPLAFIGFGVAGAGLVVTSIALIVFANGRADARNRCGELYCPPSTVSPVSGNDTIDKGYDEATKKYSGAGIIAIAGGVTTIVFGTVGIIAVGKPIKEKIVSVRPVVGPTGAGLVGTF